MFIRSQDLAEHTYGAGGNIETTTIVPSTPGATSNGASEPMRMLMVMEVVHPVHWTVRAFVDPADLRRMVKLVLMNPGLICAA